MVGCWGLELGDDTGEDWIVEMEMGRDGKVKLPKQCRLLACVHLGWHFKAGI